MNFDNGNYLVKIYIYGKITNNNLKIISYKKNIFIFNVFNKKILFLNNK